MCMYESNSNGNGELLLLLLSYSARTCVCFISSQAKYHYNYELQRAAMRQIHFPTLVMRTPPFFSHSRAPLLRCTLQHAPLRGHQVSAHCAFLRAAPTEETPRGRGQPHGAQFSESRELLELLPHETRGQRGEHINEDLGKRGGKRGGFDGGEVRWWGG